MKYIDLTEEASGGGAVINNQDITVTENGTITADSGYTGLGTVTVNVTQNCPILRVVNCGCDIDNNGIADNFSPIEEGSNIGGLRFLDSITSANNTFAKFLATKFPAKKNISFQVKFKTPPTAVYTQYFGENAQTQWSDGVHVYIPQTMDTLKMMFPTYQWKSASYNFSLDTWYIVKFTQYYSSEWKMKTEISADDGGTWTTIKDEAGRFDNDSTSLIYTMKLNNSQIGYCATYNSAAMNICEGAIDLKKTGLINNETNYSIMFSE